MQYVKRVYIPQMMDLNHVTSVVLLYVTHALKSLRKTEEIFVQIVKKIQAKDDQILIDFSFNQCLGEHLINT